MRWLIFGAGVLGSFYAVKPLACGHEVTVFARGRRAEQLRAEGLVVQVYERSYRTTRGAINVEGFDKCNVVASPEPKCGPRSN